MPGGGFRRPLLAGAVALALLLPGAGFAEEPVPADTPAKAVVEAVDNLLITTPPPPPNVRTPVLAWGEGNGKSYFIPALEILGFEALLNGYGRIAYPDLVDAKYSEGHKVYGVTPSTIWRHLTKGPWGSPITESMDEFSNNLSWMNGRKSRHQLNISWEN